MSKMHQKIRIRLGLCPTSHTESSQRYPGPAAGFGGMRVAGRRRENERGRLW